MMSIPETNWVDTLPKFNMEPKQDGLQVRNLLFQGAILRFHIKIWEGKHSCKTIQATGLKTRHG